ncbi:DUF2231 domain-containing protein [Telluribacter sp.]|jgi:uncharacterized membrane protein|uniref:DUF2231 domain-containing protein n=1 Tax=Telluribacter sp. TaxID=1978767 RepID=UPI002E0EAF49|nr:DUF2231 domain-containing protein [Telluribacter sp.]
MTEPDFWRTEIWHPLVLHFPLVLLLVSTVFQLVAVVNLKESAPFWQRAGSYLLYGGYISAWLAIYTGDLADGIVSRTICDPTVLKDHEIAAYYTAYIFSGATAVDLGLISGLIRRYRKVLRMGVFCLMLVGSGYLMYAGHLGARVVYQQAGGVKVPAADCTEYIK